MLAVNLEYERPYLYPKQFAAIFDPKRVSVVEASTKSGKTSASIVWLTEQALNGTAGQNYWWVAPVGVQAEIAFRRMRMALPRDFYAAHIQLKTLTLANGAIIWFKSGDHPDGLYGEDVYAAVIDEASRFKEEAWHAVRTTLTATRGPIRIIGNVKGRRGWFYQMARRAEHGDSDIGYHRIVAADAVAAGVLDAKEIEDAKRDLPEAVFRELYLAEPSDDGGNPFGLQHIKACIIPQLSEKPPVAWGWDLAKRQDYTVGVGLDHFGHVCRLERFHHIPWDQILENVVTITGRMPALVDSTGVGDPIVDFLHKRPGTNFEGYQFTAQSKQKLMEGLAVAIQSRAVRFPDGVLVQELEQFEYVYKRTSISYSAPEGYHDDAVMALALAVLHKGQSAPPMKITADIITQIQRSGMRRRF
jgi:phage FluMu gp28-like protein